MSEFRARCMSEETTIDFDSVMLKLTPWIYGDLAIVKHIPVIVNNDGVGRIAIKAEQWINKCWEEIDLHEIVKKGVEYYNTKESD